MREEILQLLKDLDERIDFLEDKLNMQEVINPFLEGRVSAFHEIRNKLYNILQKGITYNL